MALFFSNETTIHTNLQEEKVEEERMSLWGKIFNAVLRPVYFLVLFASAVIAVLVGIISLSSDSIIYPGDVEETQKTEVADVSVQEAAISQEDTDQLFRECFATALRCQQCTPLVQKGLKADLININQVEKGAAKYCQEHGPKLALFYLQNSGCAHSACSFEDCVNEDIKYQLETDEETRRMLKEGTLRKDEVRKTVEKACRMIWQ